MRHPDPRAISAAVCGAYSGGEIRAACRVRGAEDCGVSDGLSSCRVRPAGAQLIPRLGTRQLRRRSPKETRREVLAPRRANRQIFSRAGLPLLLVEVFDLVHSGLQVCILNRAVEIDRIAISFLELVQMQ